MPRSRHGEKYIQVLRLVLWTKWHGKHLPSLKCGASQIDKDSNSLIEQVKVSILEINILLKKKQQQQN